MTNQRYRNIYLDGCCHFCTASIFGFKPILADDDARRIIATAWNQQRNRWKVRIEGYVIIPEHFHVVVRSSAESVRKFMQYSLAQVSREIQSMLEKKASHGDTKAVEYLTHIRMSANGKSQGKLWKERFRVVPLDREDAVLVKLNYMHNNPAKRGLVEKADEWLWSSYSNYSDGIGLFDVDMPVD